MKRDNEREGIDLEGGERKSNEGYGIGKQTGRVTKERESALEGRGEWKGGMNRNNTYEDAVSKLLVLDINPKSYFFLK